MGTKLGKLIAVLSLTLTAAVALATLPGCNQAPAQNKSAQPKKATVIVSHPVKQEVFDYEEFTGRIEAANKVGIQAMVTGYLKKINFKDGDDVTEGQVLFEIDPSVFQAKLNKSKASLELAKAHFERVNADFERGKTLFTGNVSGVISREEFEKLSGDRQEALASVGMAQAQFEQDKVDFDYTKVLSPLTGRSSRHLIDVGNMVKANETMLTWIYEIDPMNGYFDVDERTVIKLRRLINDGKIKSYREGKTYVDVGLADEEGYSLKGYIDWVDSVLDAGSGTQKIRTVINQPRDPNTSKPQVLVSPGMFVRLKLPTGTPRDAILISEKSVGTDQGEKFVLIVNAQNKIERRSVKLGQMQAGLRVVENDTSAKTPELRETDWIVVSGLQRVKSGDEVDWKEAPRPRVESAPAAVNSGK